MNIFVVKAMYANRPAMAVAYERATDADAAVRQAGRRGVLVEASRADYHGAFAEPVTYYLADPAIDNIIGRSQTFDELVAQALEVLAFVSAPHGRRTSSHLDILAGDDDGPDDKAAHVFVPTDHFDWGLHVDRPALVPDAWLTTTPRMVRVGEQPVRIDPVASWHVPVATRSLLPSPLPEMDDARQRFEKMEFDRGPRGAGGGEPDPDDDPSRTRFSLLEMNGGRKRRNPARAPGDAIAKYEEFHRFEPKKIGEFEKGFSIPKVVHRGGKGLWVTYRSDKVDPATLEKPRGTVDYIHEFDAGVEIYLATGKGEACQVPPEHRQVDALVRLGTNLGFCFRTPDDEEIEAVSTRPMPELYATPDGHCLLVVQGKKKVTAMIWGGALGVFARGIDG